MQDSGGLDALVERARTGDAGAWEALYRRAYPRLLSYSRRRLPNEAARDAVAETMARAVRSFTSFRGEGAGFDAWLAGVCRHVVLDAQRRSARRPESAIDDGMEWSDATESAEERVVRAEEGSAVRAAFDGLGELDREVLELRVVMGLSAEAVAAVLGKRPGAVRMAQSRALARLRGLLEAQAAWHG